MDDSDTERIMHPIMHDFFRSIGLVTTAGVSYYFWNYVYPIRKERLITDVIWQYHIAEAKLGWLFEKINNIATPIIRRIILNLNVRRCFFSKKERKLHPTLIWNLCFCQMQNTQIMIL